MATIKFKAKLHQVWNADGTPAYQIINVPTFARSHCDMTAFRKHPKFGGLANSNLFPNVLARIRRDVFKGRNYFRMDNIPEGVSVDLSGFLAVIILNV